MRISLTFAMAAFGLSACCQIQPIEVKLEDGRIVFPKEIIKEVEQISPLAERNDKDDELQRAIKKRYLQANSVFQLQMQVFQAGSRAAPISTLHDALRQRVRSELALTDKLHEQMDVYDRAVKLATFIATASKARFEAGQFARSDLEPLFFDVYDYQVELLTLKKSADSRQKR